MEVKYKILKVIEDEHSILVRYYTDIVNEDFLAIDKNSGNIRRGPDGSPEVCRTDSNINIFQTPSPTQEEILNIIMINAPRDWLAMQESILNENVDTSLSSVVGMINQEGVLEVPLSNFTPPLELDPPLLGVFIPPDYINTANI